MRTEFLNEQGVQMSIKGINIEISLFEGQIWINFIIQTLDPGTYMK
jgi:hypothetical protein